MPNKAGSKHKAYSIVISFLIAGTLCSPAISASETDLPVVVPNKPVREANVRNRVTFEQIRRIVGTNELDTGLAIDLGDPTLQGSIFTGPYPFEAGVADYDYARYRLKSRLTNGKGVLLISELFNKYNANNWNEDSLAATPSVAYRLDLWRTEKGVADHLGFYDSVASFYKDGNKFVKSLTIVEGPFVAMVTSDDPTSLIITCTTDEPCRAQVSVFLASEGAARRGLNPKHSSGLGKPLTFLGPENETRHLVKVSGLSPATEYHYSVRCEKPGGGVAQSGLYPLRTAPPGGKASVTFALSGDSREGVGEGEQTYMGSNFRALSRIAMDAYRRGAELFLFAGDLANGYTSGKEDFQLQLKGWKQALAGFWRSRCVYACMGNHESLLNAYADGSKAGIWLDKWPYIKDSAEATFSEEFVNPQNGPEPSDRRRPPYLGNVYKFRYGPLFVIAFNNNYWWTTDSQVPKYGGSPVGFLMEDQLEWIEKALKEAESDSNVHHVVLFAHTPVFPCGGHVKDSMWWNGNNSIRAYTKIGESVVPEKSGIIEVRDRLWKAVSSCRKVAAVFTSHEHLYHRTLITSRTPVGVFPKDDTKGNGVLTAYSANPDFRYPTWHITVGTAGAPYYSPGDTPWKPEAFSSQEGYALISADSDKVSLKFITITGQIVDEIDDLMAVKRDASR